MRSYILKVDYNAKVWNKFLILGKKIHLRNNGTRPSSYIESSVKFGNSERKAKRYLALLAWHLGLNLDGCGELTMTHPTSGEERGLIFRPTSYADCSAGVYLDQE